MACGISWKYQVDFAPVFLRRRTLGGPVRRMIQLIGNLRGPEASGVAIEQIAFHGLTEAGCSSVAIGLPSRREDQRTTQRNVWSRRLLGWALQCDHIVLSVLRNAFGLAIN